MCDETFTHDEEHECAICKIDMGVKSYTTEDEDLPSEVHRLSCHHAFHSSCLLISFRTNSTVACPLCRSQDAPIHVVQRGGYNITITEAEMQEDDGRDPWQDMNSVLRRIRATSPVRKARSKLKETTRAYNTLRNELRQLRRECIANALVGFRTQFREEFRKVQRDYVAACGEVCTLERNALVNEQGTFAYSNAGWRDIHELMGTGVHIRDDSSGRRADPWNSSFWYA